MDKTAESLRAATDRYIRAHEVSRKLRGWLPPSSPGFEPPEKEELAAMGVLVTAIEEVREAQAAWVAAGRPSLG